jgi:ActR/RegA family two-component response regulator
MAGALRALVVEDDLSWQQIISEILSDCGLDVDAAANLEDATAQLKSQPHRVAVVDLSLSPNDHNNYDGLRVLDAVRRLDPGCRAILLTGFATVELAVTALTDYGAFTFLTR